MAQAAGADGASVGGLFASARLWGGFAAHAVVGGGGPAELEAGIGLSEPVRAALPDALACAEAVLAELCESPRAEGAVRDGAAPCTS